VVLRVASQRAARKAAQLAAKRAALRDLVPLTETELKTIRGGAVNPKGPLMSAEDLNKEVAQIRDGMGPKERLTDAERSGARQVLGVLERVRLNPKDADIWKGLGARRAKAMEFGAYARDGWYEIDVLEHNPGGINKIRVIFRVVNGDIEAKLLRVH